MTKQEIIDMVGNEEEANFALEILLNHIQKPFLDSVIRAELKTIENELKKFEKMGIICTTNGIKKVDWNPINGVKSYEADILLYKYNRLVSMLAVR